MDINIIWFLLISGTNVTQADTNITQFWTNITQPFSYLAENLLGDPLITGLVIFLFIMFFALMLYIPFEALVVIMLPTLFLVFNYIPQLQIVVALLVGILIGLGLLKWIRR